MRGHNAVHNDAYQNISHVRREAAYTKTSQWLSYYSENLQQSRAVTADYDAITAERRVDVAIIQEPSVNGSFKIHIQIGVRGLKM